MSTLGCKLHHNTTKQEWTRKQAWKNGVICTNKCGFFMLRRGLNLLHSNFFFISFLFWYYLKNNFIPSNSWYGINLWHVGSGLNWICRKSFVKSTHTDTHFRALWNSVHEDEKKKKKWKFTVCNKNVRFIDFNWIRNVWINYLSILWVKERIFQASINVNDYFLKLPVTSCFE